MNFNDIFKSSFLENMTGVSHHARRHGRLRRHVRRMVWIKKEKNGKAKAFPFFFGVSLGVLCRGIFAYNGYCSGGSIGAQVGGLVAFHAGAELVVVAG